MFTPNSNKIFGIGTDIVSVTRIAKLEQLWGSKFASRILGPAELQQYQQHRFKARFLAKRFAAKEACAKAFGLGFRDGLRFEHIQVSNNTKGCPELQFSGYALEFWQQKKLQQALISISDEDHFALAFVVLS